MTEESFARVARRIDGYREEAIELQRRLTAVPAIAPTSGGEGEAKKAALVRSYVEGLSLGEVTVIEAPDSRVPAGVRPNLVIRVPGKRRDTTVWVMAHLDVVPPGDLSKWESDPFTLRVDGDRIYGRGVEDNQQGICSALLAVRALKEEGLTPPCDIGLLFVADEETGSEYGISYVL